MTLLLIILLSGTTAFALWQYQRLKQNVEKAASALRAEKPLSSDYFNSSSQDSSLNSLKHSLTSLLTEIEQNRNSERHQRRFFEGMLNQIEDALFILDEHLEIRFSNEAAQRLFPSEQNNQGRQLIEVCLDHRISDAVTLALKSGNKIHDELRRPAPSSGSRHNRAEHNYLIEAEALIEKDGFGRGAWIFVRDITSQAETEQIRRDFVANASHELRTPLSIINGYLEMLDQEESPPLDPESTRRSIRTMRNHCDRITRIVEDMLSISKLENSAELLQNESFDVLAPLNNSIEQLQPLCTAQKASIKIKNTAGGQLIDGDPFYWEQIFFNLIENALKQNPKPGLKISAQISRIEDQIQISISDNGIGIPSEDLPNIFQRFYRVEKHHAQTIKGTGLGLSIVKRAIEAHHGSISASSEPGIKTTFIIMVPVSGKPH